MKNRSAVLYIWHVLPSPIFYIYNIWSWRKIKYFTFGGHAIACVLMLFFLSFKWSRHHIRYHLSVWSNVRQNVLNLPLDAPCYSPITISWQVQIFYVNTFVFSYVIIVLNIVWYWWVLMSYTLGILYTLIKFDMI